MNEDIRRIAKTLDSVGITQRYPKTAFEELQVARAATNRVTDALIRPYSHMALEFPKPLFRSIMQDAIGAQTAFPKLLSGSILPDTIGAQTAFPKPLFRSIMQDAIGTQTAFPKPLFEGITGGAMQSGLLAGITGASMQGLLDDIDIQSAHAIPLREVIGLPAQDEEYTIVQVHEDFPTAYIEHRTPQVHLPQKLQFNKQLLIKWVRVGWDWVAIVQRIHWVVENVPKWLS